LPVMPFLSPGELPPSEPAVAAVGERLLVLSPCVCLISGT
jgi:hypothetical protein